VVLAAAALTLIGWRIKSGTWNAGWLPALGVLVVACPCPLVLATPSAVMAALAALARSGVVIKGSIALERLASIDAIAFDKTGTLTHGRLLSRRAPR
jgi:P-type Cu+ transporter